MTFTGLGKFRIAGAETFALDAEGLAGFYKTLTPDAYVLVEATVTTFSFARLVQPMVKELIVANTHKLKQISLARVNTDKTDAHILSRILKMLALSGEQAAFSASVPPPEISVFIAIAVIADIISVGRFRHSKAFASCLRSAPKVSNSNTSVSVRGANKMGRKVAATLAVRALQRALSASKKRGLVRTALRRRVFAEMCQMLKKGGAPLRKGRALPRGKNGTVREFPEKRGDSRGSGLTFIIDARMPLPLTVRK